MDLDNPCSLSFFVKANYSALFYSISLTRHSAWSLRGRTDAYAVDEFGKIEDLQPSLTKQQERRVILPSSCLIVVGTLYREWKYINVLKFNSGLLICLLRFSKSNLTPLGQIAA